MDSEAMSGNNVSKRHSQDIQNTEEHRTHREKGTFSGVEELNYTVVDDSVTGSWQNSEIQMTARGVTYTGTFSQDNPTLLIFTSPTRLELRQEAAN